MSRIAQICCSTCPSSIPNISGSLTNLLDAVVTTINTVIIIVVINTFIVVFVFAFDIIVVAAQLVAFVFITPPFSYYTVEYSYQSRSMMTLYLLIYCYSYYFTSLIISAPTMLTMSMTTLSTQYLLIFYQLLVGMSIFILFCHFYSTYLIVYCFYSTYLIVY